MPVEIDEMTIEHFDTLLALWRASEGIGLSSTDSHERISAYLNRNPGLSLIALDNNELVGAILCGHDGRRGYIHHLAVAETHRHQGIGTTLVALVLLELEKVGIDKCHLFVIAENAPALAFWRSIGWQERVELKMLSRFIGE